MKMWLMGIDEAGRGPCLGPLVVAGISLPKEDEIMLEKMGIKDSKLIPNDKRIECYEWLYQQATKRGWRIEVLKASPHQIDNWMENRSLNDLEVGMFAHISNELFSFEVPKRGILHIDACDVNEEKFGNKVGSRIIGWPHPKWEIVSEHGADSKHLVVGAASIIAKVVRDSEIELLSKNESVDFGSGYPHDPKTQAQMAALVSGNIPHEMLRWVWKSSQNAWREHHNNEIPIRPRGEPLLREKNLFDF